MFSSQDACQAKRKAFFFFKWGGCGQLLTLEICFLADLLPAIFGSFLFYPTDVVFKRIELLKGKWILVEFTAHLMVFWLWLIEAKNVLVWDGGFKATALCGSCVLV